MGPQRKTFFNVSEYSAMKTVSVSVFVYILRRSSSECCSSGFKFGKFDLFWATVFLISSWDWGRITLVHACDMTSTQLRNSACIKIEIQQGLSIQYLRVLVLSVIYT